jgi:hypothetical protein
LGLSEFFLAAGDKTFTCDPVTRHSEQHIQRFVERFADDFFVDVLKPSALNKTP